MRAAVTGLALTMLAVPSAAQVAPATTLQQDFEVATALLDKGDDAAALAAYEALEKRVAKGKPQSRALVQIRKSEALMRLGRLEEAAAAARAGLALLPADNPALQGDRYNGYWSLGEVASVGLDYAEAEKSFQQAEETAPTPVDRLTALTRVIETATFIDPQAALAAATRGDALLAKEALGKENQALFHNAKAILFLNQNRLEDSRAESRTAAKLLGGAFTTRLDLYDAAARSNFAIASMLMGRKNDAQEFFAFSGAGHAPKGFLAAADMKPPECGGEAGLRPEDRAVVSFTVGSSGAVVWSAPIYASRGGNVPLAFARSVREWSWTPEQLKDVPPFWRRQVRIEMRCSTEFERPSIKDHVSRQMRDWLQSKGVSPLDPADGSDANRLASELAALKAAEAQHGRTSLAVLPHLIRLQKNALLPHDLDRLQSQQALEIMAANDAPPLVRVNFSVNLIALGSAEKGWGDHFTRPLLATMSQPPYGSDAQAHAAMALMYVDALPRRERDKAVAVLAPIARDSRFEATDPLKVGALIRLASLQQAKGDLAAARTTFEQSGLDATQCALVDAHPKLRSAVGYNAFPREALAWGFEGWSRVQFDIAANGKVLGPRVVLSYPAFIFTEAATDITSGARYEPSYRPDGSLGCGGTTVRIVFDLPQR